MASSRSRPTTPIRRVSHGSLSSSARRASASKGRGSSTGYDGTRTPLSFLSQAMSDLADETAALQANLEGVDEIQSALHTFDESFSMFLYGLKMNAFCVEWPEAPREESFRRREERREDAIDAQQSRRTPSRGHRSPSIYGADQTYMTQDDDVDTVIEPSPPSRMTQSTRAPSSASSKRDAIGSTSVPARKQNEPPIRKKITAAEKKRRDAIVEPIIDTMPLEYRGSDPTQKQLATKVVLALIAAGERGIRLNEIVRAPELPQAKVNKCLIALVAAKHVIKRSDNGAVYQLDLSRNPI